jgi:hypothetical protein
MALLIQGIGLPEECGAFPPSNVAFFPGVTVFQAGARIEKGGPAAAL